MEKHKFNIFPEMAAEEYQKLLDDLRASGYDHTQPIYIYENAVLDGWNRYKACRKLNLTPSTEDFSGTPIDAINFVMRTNKRRNLTSSQWATIAVDAEEIILFLKEATEKERREKQAETLKETLSKTESRVSDNKLSETQIKEKPLEIKPSDSPKPEDLSAAEIETFNEEKPIVESVIEYDEGFKPKSVEHKNAVATKLAGNFNTNRTYINEAEKLKKTAPEKFREVQQGTKSIPQAKKEVAAEKETAAPKPPPSVPEKERETDEFTETAARHGRVIHTLVTDLQTAIVKANNEFAKHKQDFDNYGNLRKTDLSQMVLDARMLKSLSLCANCKGGKCQWCKNTGYQSKSSYSQTKSALRK